MKLTLHPHHVGLATLAFIAMLLFFALSEAGHDEPRLIVIGDSLSTTHESWPNYLREMAPRWNVQIMAQNAPHDTRLLYTARPLDGWQETRDRDLFSRSK